ncbi:Maltose/maltodextrin ABC transporter, permease protein MalF [Minicystis rosea]|nr:Maltose/maltodextrin ABC transporter, permease protein MalF [Minicystis rosea]
MNGRRPGASRDAREAFLMLAPAAIVLAGVALFPIAAAFRLSLSRMMIVFHEQTFVGFANYAFLLRDPRFWTALGNTAYFSAVSVTLELALGLAFALLLDANAPFRGLLRAAILVPWAIPTVVAARLWAWMFNPSYGLIPHLLPLKDVDWLGTPGWAMHAAILVDVWKSTPFVALLLLAGLQTIPGDLYRAAEIDGASWWRSFRSITLPLLKPTIALCLVFRTLDAFRVFDAVYVLTGGGPANTTETLSIYTYKTLMRSGDFGYGSTLAVVTFLCVLTLSLGYLRLLRERGAGASA